MSKKITRYADSLGIITSIACAIHCTILPLLVTGLSLFSIDFLENKTVEWSMIIMALSFGLLSLGHGFRHHHKRALPLILFSIGFSFLILNQVFSERFVFLFIPMASIGIISAHVLNIYYCRLSGNCSVHNKKDQGFTSSVSRKM